MIKRYKVTYKNTVEIRELTVTGNTAKECENAAFRDAETIIAPRYPLDFDADWDLALWDLDAPQGVQHG
jgi:hypothetical protein